MGQLLVTLLGVAAAIALTIGVFVALNAYLDLAPNRFRVFATITAALAGTLVGWLAGSGLRGGRLWTIAGALVGAALGWLLWGPRPPSLATRRGIARHLRPVVFLAPALLFLTAALVIPTIRTIVLSIRSKRGTELVGIDNFRSV